MTLLLLCFGLGSELVLAAKITYTYDDAGRLKAETYDDGASASYTLDAAGNRQNVTTTAQTPVNAPTGLTVSPASATSMALSWTVPTGGNGIYTYNIYRAGSLVKSVATVSFTDTGLTAHTAYSYTVNAVDSDGNVSPQTAPSPPTYTYPNPTISSFTAATVTDAAITLTWGATDTGGPNGGSLTYSVTRGGTTVPGCTASPCTDSGLTSGTHYTYTLTATDTAGDLATATAIGGTYPLPSIQSFNAVAASSTSMTLTWVATDSGGPNGGTLTYSVKRGTTLLPGCTVSGCTDSGLAAGSSYTYTLIADDSVGDQASAMATGWTVPSPPGAPTFSSVTPTTATASWGAATGTVTSYWYSLNSGTWISTGTAQSVALTGLSPGTSYTLQVRATNTGGNSGASSGAFSTSRSDTPVMTQGSNGASVNGFKLSVGIGSMSPTTTSNGYTYQGFWDRFVVSNHTYAQTIFSVTGFAADPGQGWLSSAACNVDTRTGASATYSYTSGTAQWSWTTGQMFGDSGTVPCTIVHF